MPFTYHLEFKVISPFFLSITDNRSMDFLDTVKHVG